MNLLSVNLDSILTHIGQSELPVETKIEDQTYIDNAIGQMQMAKAYDMLDHCEKAFHMGSKAFATIDKLVALRKEQADTEKIRCVNYESLLAPFYFKMGDFLVTYIMLNTDELGTVRPFQEESDSEQEQEEEVKDGAPEEEAKQEAAPVTENAPEEESKEPAEAATTMISTNQPGKKQPEQQEEEKEKDEADYEQEAHNFLSLALQILGDFSEKAALSEEKGECRKLMAFLEIDTLLSRVQLAQHASDQKSALEDLI